uniref:Si:ch73-244f7.3 n=1 Tax=Neogobius melanostomus TaxID=47308 RepID=A0A8C6TV63_9GOBI
MTLSTLKAETLGIVLLLYFVDVPLKEESCAQIEQQSSFFYRKDKEVHHFVGQDILTEEALDSFAASTWPAVTALCQYLESHCKELDLVDKAVMEIGSGTGLVSIVAALLGAWVTATDFPDVLSNLRLNLSRNTRGKCRYTPQVAALSWSFDLERTYPTSVYHYDYVVAADVVYHYDLISKLLATMKHFCQSGTTILWANKVRADIDIEFEEIFKATFNTKLVFEDGETRIFMGTYKTFPWLQSKSDFILLLQLSV